METEKDVEIKKIKELTKKIRSGRYTMADDIKIIKEILGRIVELI